MSNVGADEYLIPSNVISKSNTLVFATIGFNVTWLGSPTDNPPPLTTILGVKIYPSPGSVIDTPETTKFWDIFDICGNLSFGLLSDAGLYPYPELSAWTDCIVPTLSDTGSNIAFEPASLVTPVIPGNIL